MAPEFGAKDVPLNGLEVPDTAHGNHSSLGTDFFSRSPSLGCLKCIPLKVGFDKDLKLYLCEIIVGYVRHTCLQRIH